VVDELPVGGAVLFTHKTLHASLPNMSNAARWSLDIRFSVLGESYSSLSDRACCGVLAFLLYAQLYQTRCV
jgi:ectoine hydroxylase-related dioxygenase (phytanoyl-CoA dioxygenase family)